MKLYPDCDYFGDESDSEFAPKSHNCEECYRWDICIESYMRTRVPISIQDLPKYIGKELWIQPPNDPKYGRFATVEDVDVEKKILWLINDFTCHQYGEIWEAYDIKGDDKE